MNYTLQLIRHSGEVVTIITKAPVHHAAKLIGDQKPGEVIRIERIQDERKD